MSKHLYMHAGPVQEARRRLQLWVGFSRFFSVDEFRTSKTCSRCHGEVERVYKPLLQQRIWAVTRCTGCGAVWNRDVNAARNMRHIVVARISNPAAERPAAFRRPQQGAAEVV